MPEIRRSGEGGTRSACRAAIGFRAHSGWAALVVLAGPPRSPVVLDRRRVELTTPGIPRQPFHAAENLPLLQAEKLIRRSETIAVDLAREALRAYLHDLRPRVHQVVAGGIVLASGRPLPHLASVLASHALIHTAEGELFRNALARACASCRLPVHRVPERELFDRASSVLRIPEGKLRTRLLALGRELGPPWTQDQKFAALIAWLALASPNETHHGSGA